MAIVVMSFAVGVSASPRNPHLDPMSVTGGCASCHAGHGAPRSPMLPGSQKQLCLSCHGSMADTARRASLGAIASTARPSLLGPTLDKLYAHPIDADATGAGTNVVTCTSCHSPHRASRDERVDPREAKRSSRDSSEMEFELCGSCHGRESGRRSRVAQKLDPNNRSFHPVEAIASEPGGSAIPDFTGGRIACTDCHGNDDPKGPRGPHASNLQFLLKADYRRSDGAESKEAFALCYECHERKKILESQPHATHVTGRGAACSTCHDGHGSVSNRALIHIGEDESLQQVLPSLSTGRLQFVSDRRGMGECYLTCHGIDHAPKSYGTNSLVADIPPLSGFPTTIGRPPVDGVLPRVIERPVERPIVRERP